MKNDSSDSLPFRRALIAAGCLGFALFAAVTPLSAELIAYEPFDYPVESGGPFGGANDLEQDGTGGTGWSSGWSDVNRRNSPDLSLTVEEGGLNYSDANGASLAAAGNAARAAGGTGDGFAQNQSSWIGRFLENPPTREPGTVIYISAIAQRVGEPLDPSSFPNDDFPADYPFGSNVYPNAATVTVLGPGHLDNLATWDIRFGNPARSYDEPNFWKVQGKDIGKLSNEWVGFEIDFAAEPPGFAVLKLEYFMRTVETDDGGTEDVLATMMTYYVNPLLESEEANEGMGIEREFVDELDPYEVRVDGVSIQVEPAKTWQQSTEGDPLELTVPRAEMLVDEIRVGTTWADVAPIGDGSGEGNSAPIDTALDFFELDEDELGDFWLNTSGLGWVYAEHYPWIYSYSESGWLYAYQTHVAFTEGSWFYDQKRAVYTYISIDYPWVYVHTQGWVDREAE